MKNRWIKWIGMAMSIAMLMLAFAISAYAEEAREEVSQEHNVTVHTSEDNSSYVYVEAEVPVGWGGSIDVTFKSLQTGKDQTVRLNYLENENQSGIWLPFGRYKVRLGFPDDDGMCLLSLANPEQETIQVEKGSDITLKVQAEENPDFDFAPPETDSPVILPLPETGEDDLAPVLPEPATEPTTQNPGSTTASVEEEISVEELPSRTGAYFVIGLLMFLVLGTVILFLLVEHRQNCDEE